MSENRETVRPRFYTEQEEDTVATKLEGRPIFRPVELVEVRTPGDRYTVGVFPVEHIHRERWPDAYAAFKRGEVHAQSGTPLEMWPAVTTSQVYELKALSIFSVEDVAGLSDTNISRLGPMGRDLRTKAIAYIESAKGGAVVSEQAAQIARLEEMVQQLMSRPTAAPVPAEEPQERDPEERALLTLNDMELKSYMRNDPDTGEERCIDDCSDAELRVFIERKTGTRPHNRTGRDKLLEQAASLATQTEAA